MSKLIPLGATVVFISTLVVAQFMHDQGELKFAVPSLADARNLDVLSLLLQGTFLLLGIVFAYWFKRLSDLRQNKVQTVDIIGEMRFMLKSVNFWLAIVASPLVFGVVYVLTDKMPLGTALFIAFQNGFFWERVTPQKPFEIKPGGE